jgi:hypothetical protein
VTDLDPAAVMAAHSPDGWADDGQGWCPSCRMFIVGPGCEAYRLAEALMDRADDYEQRTRELIEATEALAAEQAKVARVAEMWRQWLLGTINYSDMYATLSALADQPEQETIL